MSLDEVQSELAFNKGVVGVIPFLFSLIMTVAKRYFGILYARLKG